MALQSRPEAQGAAARKRRRNGPSPWLAFTAYLLLSIYWTWPLCLEMNTHCWGARFDMWGNMWLMWYFKSCLAHGTLSWRTPLIFYPEGFSLWGYGHVALQLMLCPLLFFLSPASAYGVMLLGSLSVSAWAVYLLADSEVDNRWAAFVAGGLYTFHALKYAEMSVGSLEQVATFGLPLFVLALRRWHERGGWRWMLATWAAIIGTAVCNWFFGIALTTFTVLYVLFHLIRKSSPEDKLTLDRPLLRRALALGGLCLLTTAPVLTAVRPEILTRPPLTANAVADDATAKRSPQQGPVDQDVADKIPTDLSLVTEKNINNAAVEQTINDSLPLASVLKESLIYLPHQAGPGFQLIALAALGLLLGGRRTRFWGFAFVSLMVISLGPFLRIGEEDAPLNWRLPYYFLYNGLPWFRVAYRPYRFESMALVAGTVLAAYGLAGVLNRVRHARSRAVMAIALLTTILFVRWDLCTPNRVPVLSAADIPDWYLSMQADPEAYALIEVPYHHWAYGDSNSRFQYYQTTHHKPILNNPEFINMQQLMHLRDLVKQHPLILALAEREQLRQFDAPGPWQDDVNWLRQQHFRYIVVHTSFPRDAFHLGGYHEVNEMWTEPFRAMLERLFGPPREVDGALIFDVRNGPSPSAGGLSYVGLHFANDFLESHRPEVLNGVAPLKWNLNDCRWNGLAFWALAEPGTPDVNIRVDIEGTPRSKTIFHVPLSSTEWTRVFIAADTDLAGRIVHSVAIEPSDTRLARLNLSRLQLLQTDSQRSGARGSGYAVRAHIPDP